MKKTLIIVIVILLLIAISVLLYYIYWSNSKNVTYIATIEKINDTTLFVKELPSDDKTYISSYTFSIKNVPILDSQGKKIHISDLNIGDTISIVVKPGLVLASYPAILQDIKQVQLLYKNIN